MQYSGLHCTLLFKLIPMSNALLYVTFIQKPLLYSLVHWPLKQLAAGLIGQGEHWDIRLMCTALHCTLMYIVNCTLYYTLLYYIAGTIKHAGGTPKSQNLCLTQIIWSPYSFAGSRSRTVNN